jgi:23S rRNA (adenine2503-C2)-methyltransferase
MSRRRIQISTSGSRRGLQRLLASRHAVGLTISLGGTNDSERQRVMPIPGRTGLREVLALAARYATRTRRRVTLAYVLIAGVSDNLAQAQRLIPLLRGRPFKVNLIPLNELDGDSLRPASRERARAFQEVLAAASVATFVRASGGTDIAAACGQLRRRRIIRD